jgi:hypothetical protein
MHEGETAFYIADGSFWQIATELLSATPPLLSASVSARPATIPRGTVVISEFGHEVLTGRADRIHRCGIDRWQGGVHLQGSGPIWRWDPETASLCTR